MTRHKKISSTASEKGQSLTEFALVATALLLSMFIIIESGRIFWAWNTVQNAAREGVRYAVTGQKMPGGDCPVADLPKFNGIQRTQNNACRKVDDRRPASIIRITHDAMTGLPLNENSTDENDANYYDIHLFGADKLGNLRGSLEPEPFGPDPYAGDPSQQVSVRVFYRVPIITPGLSGIIPSVEVEGVATESNEPFGQLGNAKQGIGLPPGSFILPDFLPPTAVNDDYSTPKDTTLVVPSPDGLYQSILANDDLQGGTIVSPTLTTAQGVPIQLGIDGSFTYTPPAGYEGADSFTYTLGNGKGTSEPALVTIIVNPPPPIANDDQYEIKGNEILRAPSLIDNNPNILDNDELNGAGLVTSPPAVTALGVTVQLGVDGSFEYTPPEKNNTIAYTDTFSYTLRNANPTNGTASATVRITVNPPPPFARNDSGSLYTTFINTPLSVPAAGVLTNDDVYGPTTITYDAQTTQGGTVVLQQDGSFVYTPRTGYVSDLVNFIGDTFNYTLTSDLGSGSASARVTIYVYPLDPIAKDDSEYRTPMNTPLTTTAANGVLNNDTLNGATIVAYDQTTQRGGRVNLNTADGSFTYTPATDIVSPPVDTFTYTLQNSLATSVATVSIYVDPPFPIAFDDFYATPVNTLLRVPAGAGLLANDIAKDGTITRFDSRSTQGGTVMVNANGSFDYQPPADFESLPNDSFTYEVSNSSGSDTGLVQIFVGEALANQRISGVARLVLPVPTEQEGVLVTLYDSNSTMLTTTQTDVRGFYQFQTLPPGIYTLTACYRLANQEYSAVITSSSPNNFADLFLTPGPCTNP